jgi:hypothetical protein
MYVGERSGCRSCGGTSVTRAEHRLLFRKEKDGKKLKRYHLDRASAMQDLVVRTRFVEI